MFSGGTYEEVGRWLRMFLVSHAKREHPRIEVILEAGDGREDDSYGARLVLDGRLSARLELGYRQVADNRGSLAWCAALATRVREQAHDLLVGGGAGHARAR